MKKTIYIQPQTTTVCVFPQMLMDIGEGSHKTGTLPENPPTPGSGGLGSPARRLYI